MAEALRDRLATSADIAVVGTANSAEDLLRLLPGAHPDVVVLDNRMPDRSGTDCTRDILSSLPGCRVLMLSAYTDPPLVAAALDAGASAYIEKSVSGPELVKAVLEVALRTPQADDAARRRRLHSVQSVDGAPPPALSARELEVLRLVADGHTNSEIASRLGIGSQTVKTYIERIFTKLGVNDRTAAVRHAIKLGMLS